MKILKLRLENIHSLKGEFTIDFTLPPISNTGLFAIVGETGAGKSTLLDAITLALYDETSRHQNTGAEKMNSDEFKENIMSKGTSKCFAEITFEVKKTQYLCRWEAKRARGKLEGKIQETGMFFQNLSDESETESQLSKVKAKIIEITQLNYDQFLRSVMLAQGEFTKFLKANAKERTELLEKVTGTEIYSRLSKAAHLKTADEKRIQQDIEKQLAGVEILTREEEQGKKEEIKQVEETAKRYQSDLKNLTAQRTWREQLDGLEEEFRKLQQTEKVLNDEFETEKQNFDILLLHQKASPFLPDFSLIDAEQKKLEKKKEELESCTLLKQTLENKKQEANQKAEEARKVNQDAKLEQIRILELVDLEVLPLDSQIINLTGNFNVDTENYTNQCTDFQAKETLFKTEEQTYSELNVNIGEVHLWLEQNKAFETINLALIEEKLNQLRELRKDLNTNKIQLDPIAIEIEKLIPLDEKEQEKSKLIQKREEEYKKYQAGNKDLLKNNTLPVLQKELDDLKSLQPKLERQSTLINELEEKQKKINENKELISNNESSLQTESDNIKKLEFDKKQLEDTKLLLEKLYEQAKAIQKYEEARLELTENEPCPLCGSEHHPFVSGYQNTVNQDKENLNLQQKKLEELNKTLQEKNIIIATINETILQYKKNIQELEIDRIKLEKEFNEIQSNTLPVFSLNDYALILDTATKNQAQINILQPDIQTIHSNAEKMNELEIQIRLLKDFQKLAEEKKAIEDRGRKLSEELKEILIPYHLEVPKSEDKNNELLEKLKTSLVDLKTKTEQSQSFLKEKIRIEANIKNLKEQLEKEKGVLDKIKIELDQKSKNIEELKVKRFGVFGDKNIQEEKNKLKTLEEKTKILFEQAEKRFQEEKEKEADNQKAIERIGNELFRMNEDLDSRLNGFMKKIEPEGFENLIGFKNAVLPIEEAIAIEKRKIKLNTERIELNAHLTKNREVYRQKSAENLSGKSLAELLDEIELKESKITNFQEKQAHIQQLLKNNQENKNKFAEIQKALDIQKGEYNKWLGLSNLIGSSDGKKFSEFAQTLTLSKLVYLANEHLKELNTRYSLQKSEDKSLGLEIVDNEQNNEKRSVSSLSGGESFLVSLALALGLSDLSSKNSSIESLFIDEGFGTLDPSTLDMALDALEKLQGRGKIIGIISHVEAIKSKDRIPVQIEIRKKGGGISEIILPTL